jgi:hypothetical protein
MKGLETMDFGMINDERCCWKEDEVEIGQSHS